MNRGLFPNALHVARREYLFRVRGRAFKITTALLALAVIAFTQLPTFLSIIGVDDPPELAIYVDADGLTADPVLAIQTVLVAGAGGPGGGQPDEPADPEDVARVTRTDDPEAAAAQVRDDELDGLLTITRPAADGDLVFEYIGSPNPTNTTSLLVRQAATAIAISDRLERAGISAGESAELFAPAEYTITAADPDDAQNEEDFGGSLMLAYVVVILTFMAILTYGQWVAQSVAEEKSGRVMELLITAATPRQLLTGKVIGTGAAGLTQYLVLIVAVVAGLLLSGPINDMLGAGGVADGFALPQIDPVWLVTFTAFFLLGFALYSTLYAAGGSMVSRIEDVQQAVGPLIYLALAGYFIAFAGLNDPDTNWVAIASMVPFFSPYIMPARMLLGSPAPWEVVVALVLLALTLALAIWIASRIYSAGVLLYGQRVGFRTIFRATRVAR